MPDFDGVPASLSEMDRLKLTLAKEREARLRAEAANLQMAQRALDAAMARASQEAAALSAELRQRYALAPGDEIAEDGGIRRSPVRALETPKEG
jgi:hypothetical protein